MNFHLLQKQSLLTRLASLPGCFGYARKIGQTRVKVFWYIFRILLLPSALASWSFVCAIAICPKKLHICADGSHHNEMFVDKNAMESTTTFFIRVDVFIHLTGIVNIWKFLKCNNYCRYNVVTVCFYNCNYVLKLLLQWYFFSVLHTSLPELN